MKFNSSRNYENGGNIFQVEVEDTELAFKYFTSRKLEVFQSYVLSRLVDMIAAYYFKKHREDIEKFITKEVMEKAIYEKIKESIRIGN